MKDILLDAMENLEFSLSDLANIRKGQIARVFGQGGGIQIHFGQSLQYYEILGILREVTK